MGYVPEYFYFEENDSKENMLWRINNFLYSVSDGFRRLDSLNGIHWYSKHICEDEEDAIDYLDEKEGNGRDDSAVRYKVLKSGTKFSKKYLELKNKFKDAELQYRTANQHIYARGLKSQYITCKICGSKMNKDYIKSNFCPFCNTDMRPETVRNKIAGYATKVKRIEYALKEEEKKIIDKNCAYMWLVKIWYFDD